MPTPDVLFVARVALRRDRWLIGCWLVVITSIVAASAWATPGLYHSDAERVAAAKAITGDPALVALYGPIHDVHSIGELSMTKLTVLYALAVAFLALVIVRRHTRTEEEQGVAELVAATRISPRAQLLGAALAAICATTAAGTLAAVVDIAGGLPVTGSIVFGLSWAGVGLFGVAVAALAMQVSVSSRVCAEIAAGVLVLAYAARAVGDVDDRWAWLGWLSPMGWTVRVQAWSDPRWWVLLLPLVVAAGGLRLAVVLRERRDLAGGLIPVRGGAARAPASLSGMAGLAWRLHRTSLAWWCVTFLLAGLFVGALAPDIDQMLTTDDARRMIEAMGGRSALSDSLVSAILGLLAVAAAAWPVVVVAHAMGDETSGRAELLLSTALRRRRQAAIVTLTALAGPLVVLLVAGVGAWAGLQAAGEGHGLGALLLAALVRVPAAWMVGVVALLLWGLRPQWAMLGWAVLALAVVLDELGPVLRLPGWVRGISPFHHVPDLPGGNASATSTLVMTVIAVALVLGVLWAQPRRDIG